MNQKAFNSSIFKTYEPGRDKVSQSYKKLPKSQKLALNDKGKHQITLEIAKQLALDFSEQPVEDPEFSLIFNIKPNLYAKARGIIKSLFIKVADKVITQDQTVLNQIISDCLNQGLFKKYNRLEEENQILKQGAKLDNASFVELQETREENRRLRKENEQLKEALAIASLNANLNSSNSNLPPSSDLFKPKKSTKKMEPAGKPKESPKKAKTKDKKKKSKKIEVYNTREKTGRKKGAQPGHKGGTLTMERIKQLLKSGVKKQVVEIGEIKGNAYKSGYILDLDIIPVIKEIRVAADKALPKELRGGPTYGLAVREFVVLLSTEGLMGYERLANILNQLSGNILGISTGSVYAYAQEFFQFCLPEYFKIMESLKKSPILATDATSFKVNGKRNYVRNHSTPELVWYFPCFSKKKKEFFLNPLLNSFHGILLHDHETGLYNLDCDHAECNIHGFRPMIKIKMLTGHQWPDKLISLLCEYNNKRKALAREGKISFNKQELEQFEKDFEKIINLARRENKTEKRKKIKKKECRLINKILKYKTAYTLFLYNFDVDFTDNISERDLRIVVRKRKMIGTFRSFHGLEIFCVTLSIIESSKKQGIPILTTIKKIYTQNSLFWTI